MINLTLYKKEWKKNWVTLIIFLAVLTMYVTMIISMFDPEMGDSLRTMAESMPEVFAAFGMADVGTTLIEFITGYLYGILLTAFPAVYIIIVSNRLVAKYVDDGSMAYLLSVPEKRTKIVVTQAFFLISGLVAMVLYVIAVILLTSQILFPGKMDIAALIRVNVGIMGVWIMMGGVCFMSSCIFNESRRAVGASSAFVVYSLLVQMVSQVGEKFENLKYATPLTLFQIDELIANTGLAWILCGIMYLAGVICFVAGILVFRKKDLPI
ncbi:MAG: ABC transporter permease [Clostridia bacterium]|nr:ABC transporter permease [Clostridia bacterium]NCC43186.1 ABC transporter permease [Clostridia bacterium]